MYGLQDIRRNPFFLAVMDKARSDLTQFRVKQL